MSNTLKLLMCHFLSTVYCLKYTIKTLGLENDGNSLFYVINSWKYAKNQNI